VSGIYRVLNLSKNKITSKTLLVGDSICAQFFGELKSEEVLCLCENQAYEVVGNFLILNELLKNKSNFKSFVLIINPLTLTRSLNQEYTYNYFYKPFKNTLNNFESLDERTQIYIEKTFSNTYRIEPRYFFSSKSFSTSESFFGNDNLIDSIEKFEISDLNYEYLLKIKNICIENDIEFKLVSPPLPEKFKSRVDKFSNNDLIEFSDYFNSILYYSDDFSNDGIHHKNPDLLKSKINFLNYSSNFLR
jgi:hypothetical protein